MSAGIWNASRSTAGMTVHGEPDEARSRARRSGVLRYGVMAAGVVLLASCGGDTEEQMVPDTADVEVGPAPVVEVVDDVQPDSPLADVDLVRSPDVGPAYPNARITFSTPEAGARFETGEAIEVGFSLSGYELGGPTPDGDARGIARSPDGQHIHFIVNDRTYQAHYDADEPIVVNDLPSGTHVLRAFPGRDWHESVKTPGALAQRLIVVGDDPAAYPPVEEWGPTLIYSRPQGSYEGAAADSVMVDFVLSNVRLAPEGHQVRITLNGERQFVVNEWAPFLLVGVPDGEHVIRVELLDAEGVPVEAPFHPVEREFTVRR